VQHPVSDLSLSLDFLAFPFTCLTQLLGGSDFRVLVVAVAGSPQPLPQVRASR
jgi:hypothetical protein